MTRFVHRDGFTLDELAALMGHQNVSVISRHERGITVPSLAVALHYEALFQVPVSELFPAIYEVAVRTIDARLADLKAVLGQKSANGPDADEIARKLQFISARKTEFEV